MIRILFVCHGNICRSPMAEFYMKDLVKKEHRSNQFHIESAATTSEEIWLGRGNPIYPPALKQLQAHGIGTADNELGVHEKSARLIKEEDYDSFDLLIGMDEENIVMMKAKWNDTSHKIHLLLDYAGLHRDVADPWYTRNFKAAWDDIALGCDALYQSLQ
ncbi:low molecular weight protein-tyrosine-phosphatase [Galactobacillus timonensis]|uniref:low molecular weight protein-tyrosine-phosphatase n=1 Tax=Galactobacillus timonensis TaxID=2041840 RepID=UPI00240A6583|nr:low molecular weight protein-tyrosine-phosphatase [Galactobacillus timonensis]MDD6680026.1 low molecular weight phosphotyrosine protein phosphatase [Galactobacillus timonensis]